MENNRAYLLRTEITKSHLNNRICQHCGVKTSTVTPSFHYVFNITLPCNINIPTFIGNLWWDLLLGNHLNIVFLDSTRDGYSKWEVADISFLKIVSSVTWRYWGKILTQYGLTSPKRPRPVSDREAESSEYNNNTITHPESPSPLCTRCIGEYLTRLPQPGYEHQPCTFEHPQITAWMS